MRVVVATGSNSNGYWDDINFQMDFYGGIALLIIGGIYLILMCCMCKKILIAIKCVEMASDAVGDTPTIVLIPFVLGLVGILTFVVWCVTAVLLFSAGDVRARGLDVRCMLVAAALTHPDAGVRFCVRRWWRPTRLRTWFPTACTRSSSSTASCSTRPCTTCLACSGPRSSSARSASCAWPTSSCGGSLPRCAPVLMRCALTPPPPHVLACHTCHTPHVLPPPPLPPRHAQRNNGQRQLPGTPVLTAWKNTMKHHMGSIAFGSLIIAVIKMVRAILEYIQRK